MTTSNFTYQDALNIQAEQLRILSLITKPEIMAKVTELVLSTNYDGQLPHAVMRGSNIDNLIGNIALRLNDGYSLDSLTINTKYFSLNFPETPAPAPQPTGLTMFEAWNAGIVGNFGSFQTTLFKAYQLADSGNMERLQNAFPYWFTEPTKYHR